MHAELTLSAFALAPNSCLLFANKTFAKNSLRLTMRSNLHGLWETVSLERLIEDNKERYYEVVEQSSTHWHEGKHDPWPTMNFLLFILTPACKEFEQRIGQLKSPRGEKTAMVLAVIDRQVSTFRVADLQAGCHGVGLDLIRRLLGRLQREKKIKSLGTGRGAKWQKLGN
jgi:hypothetical protein